MKRKFNELLGYLEELRKAHSGKDATMTNKEFCEKLFPIDRSLRDIAEMLPYYDYCDYCGSRNNIQTVKNQTMCYRCFTTSKDSKPLSNLK